MKDDELDLALPAFAPPPLSAQLAGELAELSPVRTRRPALQLVKLVGFSLLYAAALVAVLSLRRDARELPPAWLVAAGFAWLVGFVLPLYLALVPPRGAVMPRWQLAAGAAIAAAATFVLLGLAIHPSGASSVHYGAERFVHGHHCLEIGLATALVPACIGAIMLRGCAPVAARWIAAALGAGAGSLGGLVLHLHCHVADALHVGLVHGGVVAVSALLAAAIVPRAIH